VRARCPFKGIGFEERSEGTSGKVTNKNSGPSQPSQPPNERGSPRTEEEPQGKGRGRGGAAGFDWKRENRKESRHSDIEMLWVSNIVFVMRNVELGFRK